MRHEKNLFQQSIDTLKFDLKVVISIDAELFTKTMNNTIELLKALSLAINPNAFLRIEIRELKEKEGSFETVLDVATKYTEHDK